MHRLFTEGLATMTAKEMDVRLSRRPIERYEWPLAFATASLAVSLLMNERKRSRIRRLARSNNRLVPATVAALLFISTASTYSANGGLDFYRNGKYAEAFQAFEEDIKSHPDAPEKDKMQFDAGAAAYNLHNYDKAAEAFSEALLSASPDLQSKSHFNLGNTLYRRGEAFENDQKKLTDWNNALQHYEETLKLEPNSKEAKDNYEYVKRKIEELKRKPKSENPSPPPKKQKPIEPSEAAKRAKAEADKAVRQTEYKKAYDIMMKQLTVDSTVYYYADYIQRLEAINGIKQSIGAP
jgi:tetratricopeptide (TPR) repeat protein